MQLESAAEKARDAADRVRVAKWTAIIVGSIVLLLAATMFVMTSVIDPNRYRGKIEGIVADLAGRPFVIEGDLEMTWFPWLGVRMGSAHLGDAGSPLAAWQSVTVAAKVLPLLKGDVVVDYIRLKGAHIRLHRDALGRGNWEGLGPRSPASASGQKSPPQIAGVEIRDGILEYVDEVSGLQLSLSGLELDLGEWRPAQSIPVHARFLLQTATLPPGGVWIQVDAPELEVRAEPLSIAAPKLLVNIANAQIDSDFAYQKTADAHVLARGTAKIHVPSVRQLVNELALNQTMPHDPTTLGPLGLEGSWSYTDGALAAKPVSLQIDGVNFKGWLERTPAPRAAWTFELHGDRIDLGRYVNVDSTNKKPFELPVAALRAINANGSLIFDQARIADTRMTDVRLRFQTPEAGP